MRLRKLVMPMLIIIGIFFIGGVSLFAKGLLGRKTIIVENKDDVVEASALKEEVKDNVLTASPIIYTNILIGGKYGNSIIDAKTYLDGNTRTGIQISAFNENGRMGLFKLKGYKPVSTDVTLVETSINNTRQEYVAVEGDKQIANRYFSVLKDENTIKEAEKTVKKAISKYLLPNNSIQIQKVVGLSITKETSGKVIIATSKQDTVKKGVYSVAIYQEENKAPQIIKLYYARNQKALLSNWPVYDLKFACDLNDDEKYELILEEVTESKVKIDIMEYRDNKFYQVVQQVLSSK